MNRTSIGTFYVGQKNNIFSPTVHWKGLRIPHPNRVLLVKIYAHFHIFPTNADAFIIGNLGGDRVDHVNEIPTIINGDDEFVENIDKANAFNDYFATQASVDDSNAFLPPPTDPPHNFSHIDISENDVKDILSLLDVSKACGPDLVKARLLKEAGSVLCIPLAKIFNKSLSLSRFPDTWKKANVTPVHKKENSALIKNYRPISLLSIIGKVMEKCIFKYLHNFVLDHSVLSVHQSGFSLGDSTVNQLLYISNDIIRALDSGKEVRAVFCDISRAFDRVWHTGLLYKLSEIGISGNLLSWFHSYLHNRYQRLVINGIETDWLSISAGVPQGSILGPILFLIYINDIVQDINSSIKLFADDTTLYVIVDSPASAANSLNNDLDTIHAWSLKWLVDFSPDKTEVMIFSKKRAPSQHPSLFLNDTCLTEVPSHRHLGLTFSSDLSWDTHIHNAIGKVIPKLNIMRKLKFRLDRFSLQQIFFSFIRPVLEYADIVWDSLPLRLIRRLENINLEAARIVTAATKLVSHQNLYLDTKWDSFDDRRCKHRLILFHKIVHGKTPSYLRELLPPQHHQIHNYSTRNRSDFEQFHPRTNLYRNSFSLIQLRNGTIYLRILIPCELKFGLDDESEGSIAIPLTALAEKSQRNKKSQKTKSQSQNTGHIIDPVCLPSHFRLLRMCEQRQAGTLENIDALLGCPLFITKEDVYQKLEPLSTREKDVICESLFHTLNWFREVINAFATQVDVEMKGKVISRLQNISEMQSILEKCLSVHPSFQPPPATFDWYESPVVHISPAQTTNGKKRDKKAGKKKKGDKENVPDEDGDESIRDTTVIDKSVLPDTQGVDGKQSSDKASINLSNYRPFFRELDIEVFTILNTGMITKSNLDTEMNTKATTELSIGPEQLEFLLDDLSRKLSHSLIASTSKRKCFLKPKSDKNVGFCHLDQLSSVAVATKAVKLLSAICDHLEGASGYFQTLIDENDGLIDGPGSFSPQSALMGNCFHLLLQILLSIISWNGFIMTENRDLFKEVLETIASRIKSSAATQAGFQELIKQVICPLIILCSFQYIENFAETVPNLKTGITLVKLLSTLSEKSDSTNLTGKITNVCENFLKREWFSPDGEKEKGAKHNENLQVILKKYLVTSPDILAVAESIATKGIPELIETDKNGSSSTYPTLTRSSFPLFYRALFIELVDCVKGINPCKPSDTSEERLDKLLKWNQAVRILHILINLIKAFDARSNLGSSLKYGRQFIEIFLRQGMPLLDQMFRGHRDDVQGLLKNLQLSTRNLHHMCGHSKIVKDIALTNQVPLLKKCLEAFVYRVKAMLTLNKCLEAFWLGNLKNKDLRGEEIVSQSTVADDESSVGNPEEDQGELEEECSDVELEDQSDTGDDGSRDGNTSDNESCSGKLTKMKFDNFIMFRIFHFVIGLALVTQSVNSIGRNKREDESLGDIFQDIINSLDGGETQAPTTTSSAITQQEAAQNSAQTSIVTTTTTSSDMTSVSTQQSVSPSVKYNATTNSSTSMTPAQETVLTTTANIDADFAVKETNEAPIDFPETTTSNPATTTAESTDANETKLSTLNSEELAEMLGFTPPPASTANPNCDTHQTLDSQCDLSGLPDLLQGINIWNVYSTMFADTVVEALLLNCASGSWCLKNDYNAYKAAMADKADMVRTSPFFAAVCEPKAQTCVRNVVNRFSNCIVGPRLNFTSDAVDLLCTMRSSGPPEIPCFQQTIAALHVSIMDIVRQENKKEAPNPGIVDGICDTTQAKMTSTYLCTTYKCPNYTDYNLQNFRPWQWFVDGVSNLKEACLYGDNTCAEEGKSLTTSTLQYPPLIGNIDSGGVEAPTIQTMPNPPVTTETYTDQHIWMKDTDLKMIAGVSVGALVIVLGVVITTFICIKKYRGSSAGKIGYKPLASHAP
ncbi:hypothetical protein FSP39_004973 [Pinctada imbricata]|uniref:Reverse transcriptase domain-containing protein n=1 Tax=Pinctada imbricata TaxID=66713 RepID=A0AA89C589_PINIB|nr:hypothetical protein FSP39_004973 [Pinctada imbricata]